MIIATKVIISIKNLHLLANAAKKKKACVELRHRLKQIHFNTRAKKEEVSLLYSINSTPHQCM